MAAAWSPLNPSPFCPTKDSRGSQKGGTHCCSQRRDHAESQCVAWTARGPGFNHGHTVHDLGAVCHSAATLGSFESCFGKAVEATGMGQALLPLHMKPPCAPGHLPALREGSPCLAAEQSSPTVSSPLTLPAQNNPLQKSHGTAFMLCHIFGTYGFK